MTQADQTGFERDILGQASALLDFCATPFPQSLIDLTFPAFDRIILTGMGSSDYVTIGIELALARKGLPVWRIQTSHLLQAPARITPRTLLLVVSQSGRSGEVVSLLDRLKTHPHGPIIGITNDAESPLGRMADHLILLHSGIEATVSSKSYINTLAALDRMQAVLEGQEDAGVVQILRQLAAQIAAATQHLPASIQSIATRAMAATRPRFALIGTGVDATTSLTGALIMKEASKVAAQGYVGGEFRHGPLEIAGCGLTALLFCADAEDITLSALAKDIAATGAMVVVIGPYGLPGAEHFKITAQTDVARLALAMVFIQHFSVALARIGGYAPGDFLYGKKVTSQL